MGIRLTNLLLSVIVASAVASLATATVKSRAEQAINTLTMRHVNHVALAVPPEAVPEALLTAQVARAAAKPKEAPKALPVRKEAPVVPEKAELMRRISWCESRWRQYDADGSVLSGPDGHDKGYYQVRATVHAKDASRLGHDIMTREGNEAYAWHLLKTQGTAPWKSSAYCWQSEKVLKQRGYPGL